MVVPDDRLDVEICISSGQVFRWDKLDDGSWLGVDGAHWFRIAGRSPFEVESNGTEADFSSLFRLDWDAADVESRILAVAPEIGPSLSRLKGLRVFRRQCPEEVLFSFLCTPNNHLSRIVPMVRYLASLGEAIGHVGGREVRRFPTAEQIAAIPESHLREKGFGYRAATIPAAARQLVSCGEGWLTSLKSLEYPEAHAALCEIGGIGPKLADCIALFGLDHTEAAPVDTHLWQAMTRLYYPEWVGLSVTDQRYRIVAADLRDRLGPLTGWAHQYLFYDNLLRHRKRA